MVIECSHRVVTYTLHFVFTHCLGSLAGIIFSFLSLLNELNPLTDFVVVVVDASGPAFVSQETLQQVGWEMGRPQRLDGSIELVVERCDWSHFFSGRLGSTGRESGAGYGG